MIFNAMNTTSINLLNEDIFQQIIEFCPTKDRHSLLQVSKKLNEVIQPYFELAKPVAKSMRNIYDNEIEKYNNHTSKFSSALNSFVSIFPEDIFYPSYFSPLFLVGDLFACCIPNFYECQDERKAHQINLITAEKIKVNRIDYIHTFCEQIDKNFSPFGSVKWFNKIPFSDYKLSSLNINVLDALKARENAVIKYICEKGVLNLNIQIKFKKASCKNLYYISYYLPNYHRASWVRLYNKDASNMLSKENKEKILIDQDCNAELKALLMDKHPEMELVGNHPINKKVSNQEQKIEIN